MTTGPAFGPYWSYRTTGADSDDHRAHGYEVLAEIEYSSGYYEFDRVRFIRQTSTGAIFAIEDSGCSCPSPFEDTTVADFKPIRTLTDFEAAASANRYASANAGDLISETSHARDVVRAALREWGRKK